MPPQMNELVSNVISLNSHAVQLNERMRLDISCKNVQSSGEIEAYYEKPPVHGVDIMLMFVLSM